VKPAAFAYSRPASVAEAVALLAEHGEEAKVLAGGQSLVPLMNMRLARPGLLVDLNRVDGLGGWHRNGDLSLGAMVRQAQLADDPFLGAVAPLLAQAARHIGHVATRSRGTLGGSLAHADPAAELPATLLALEAEVTATSTQGRRCLAMHDFLRGFFSTALAEDELLLSVDIPSDRLAMSWGFAEIARRRADFALAGVVTTLDTSKETCRSLRVVAFGDTPVRLPAVEERATGLPADQLAATIGNEAEALVGKSLPENSDVYRREATAVLVRRVFANLSPGGGDPAGEGDRR
jgi:aerobic carbon-monoxide dehydrogenase medium subunit